MLGLAPGGACANWRPSPRVVESAAAAKCRPGARPPEASGARRAGTGCGPRPGAQASQFGLRLAMKAPTPSAASGPSMLHVIARLAEAYACVSFASSCS
jgi:hypothetical protein